MPEISDRDRRLVNRRRFVQFAGASSALALAGCTGDGEDDGAADDGEDGAYDGGDGDDGSDGGDGDAEYELRVGTSAGGTKDVGLAVERAVSQHSDALDYATIESPGYIGTIRRMDQDQFEAGITDNNSISKALDDRGDFEEEGVDDVPWYGFYAFPYSIYIVAREETDIETFDDLAGKNVYPAEPGYSTRATTLDVWSQDPTADVYEEMNVLNLSVDDAPGRFEEGEIDAAIAYGTPGVRYTGWVQEYSSRVGVKYVEPTDALIESAESYDGAGANRTSYDDWDMGQDIGTDEVFHWDLQVNYMFNPEAEDEAVHELCRVVDEHNDTIQEAEEQMNDFDDGVEAMHASSMERVPVHPGAAEYYKDNDAWDDNLEVGER